jgi:hypothetical protein
MFGWGRRERLVGGGKARNENLPLTRQRLGEQYPHLNVPGLRTETSRILVHGERHAAFVTHKPDMQALFDKFLDETGKKRFLDGYE